MAEKGRVLIIGEEEPAGRACRQILELRGFRTASSESAEQALEIIRLESFDVALLDSALQELPGMDLLRRLKQASPSTAIIITSQNPTISSVVESIRAGAYDYLPKPFQPDALIKLVEQAAGAARRVLENSCIGQELQRQMLSQVLIGRSEAMTRVARLVHKAAPVDSTVLITGETGVGKEVVARAIHRLSHRSNKPFVTVDCGSLVESLFESELFGHVKGSFSGAVENTIGKIEQADGGTLFLDEIANVSITMQARLLRAVQEREVSRIGSTIRKKIDVRILSATNRDLQQAVQEGKFREDLFYRLNVIHISVPPLRERLEDIPALVDYYLKKLTSEKGRRPVSLSDEAMRFLKRSEWPGNVRELINALEYAVVTCEGDTVELKDLPHGTGGVAAGKAADGGSLARLEQNEILNALSQFRGNKTKAAEYLGINRKTLREKIQKYGL
ncbi:MAG: sigma-54 dependent transcriptional regulator [Acidobacteriota bacterium]|jgi:DNA-binding NtrC family response regulator|nr:sigma-54 dependent transcriptional regulator [Acidobacteriota bacterium]